jgi:hypothetical protein
LPPGLASDFGILEPGGTSKKIDARGRFLDKIIEKKSKESRRKKNED